MIPKSFALVLALDFNFFLGHSAGNLTNLKGKKDMSTLYSFSKHLFVLTIFVFGTLLLSNSHADAASSIAVVNIQKIMKESKAAQAVRNQVTAKQKSFQTELDKKEDELQKEDQELAKQRSVLSPEAFEKKYKDFRKKAAEAQKEVREKRNKLDKGFTEALSEIQKKVSDIVAGIAKEKGVEVALANTPVLYVTPDLDITDAVLSKLDAQLPNVTVNFN